MRSSLKSRSTGPRSIGRRLRFATFGAAVALSLAFGTSLPTYAAAADAPLVTGLPSFAPLIKKVMPAVVNVSATLKSDATLSDDVQGGDDDQDQNGPQMGPQEGFPQSPFDEMLRRYFQQQGHAAPRETGHAVALGSGFIIDPTGYIVTNNHVVKDAVKVSVIFQDGSEHAAKIIGRDAKTDLALLKIDAPQPLPFVTWGDSSAEQVGDWVVAVGNPFGLGGSVSPGTIAARGRDINAGPYDDFLQIDASINRGNSGGPSFNLDGQVVGINTAIYSPNGGSVGIGFAIPADLAKPVIDQLRAHGTVARGWLGVEIQAVTPDLAKSLALPKEEGALVAGVTPDSPAAKAGFKPGDVILSFAGHDIDKEHALPITVAETPIGQAAPVRVWRNGAETTLTATIAAMPANPQLAQNSGSDATDGSAMGLELAPLSSDWRQRLHLHDDVDGVVVTSVADDSPLAELGLQRGDVIESVNQKPVTTPDQVASTLAAAKTDKSNILLLLNRNGMNQYVALSLGDQGNG
jgi:serine protease Do